MCVDICLLVLRHLCTVQVLSTPHWSHFSLIASFPNVLAILVLDPMALASAMPTLAFGPT